MEKITVPFELKRFDTESNDDYYVFEGYVAAFGNVDYGNDRIIKGAFADFLANPPKDKIPALWQHRHSEPVGIFPVSEMREEDKGLFVRGYLPKDDEFVTKRVVPQMRIGSVGEMSIGYDALEWGRDGDIRTLEKLHLWEGSLVTIAMNNQAVITSLKSVVPYDDLPMADRSRAWESDSALGRVREWAGVDDNGSLEDPEVQQKYRQAFFWFDGADADLLGAYKLPFADVIDGQLQAVPRGVFAAAAAMRGARGGVYMPSSDRPGVIRNIEKYYDKMGLESPFSKTFRIDDIDAVDIRALEKMLREGVRFSNKQAKKLISIVKSLSHRDDDQGGLRDGEWLDQLHKELSNVLTKIGGKTNARKEPGSRDKNQS